MNRFVIALVVAAALFAGCGDGGGACTEKPVFGGGSEPVLDCSSIDGKTARCRYVGMTEDSQVGGDTHCFDGNGVLVTINGKPVNNG